MRNLFIAFSLLFCCSACELSEQVDLHINYRPTLFLRYSFLNNQQQEVVDKRVSEMKCFVFDEKGVLFHQIVVSTDTLSPRGGMKLLYGVPDGRYRVCSFANGVPQTRETIAQIVTSTDSLYYHMEWYHVVRGHIVEHEALLRSLFCRVSVLIEGISLDNESWYSVEISGVPSGFNYEGDILETTVSVEPSLKLSTSGLQGNCCIYRMEDPTAVKICLREKRPNGSYALLFEQSLGDFLMNIDMSQPDISIPICIRLHKGGATISIRDWEKEMEQIEEVGG